jgi:glyoxylase-like metal-dependent hydrolase (beta-lactamase superfamily II)
MTRTSAALHYPFEHAPAAGTTLEVAPGLRWLRMPLPFQLDHINLWAVEDGEGWTLVDAGIALDPVKDHWQAILANDLGGRLPRRLIVTHFHPDHFGLAGWFAAQHGLPVLMPQAEYLTALAIWEQVGGYAIPAMLEQFRRHGLADERCEALARRGNAYRRGVPVLPASYRRIIDGERIAIGGRDWQVMSGYGHSPEHAALYCAELGVLIAGDMVLPRISTNVSVMAATPEADSLRLFLDSLARYAKLPEDTLVLPSHGRPFRGLQARVGQLAAHHRERCDLLLAACETPRTAWELVPALFPRELDTHQTMFAMGEAIAHLNHLEQARELARIEENAVVRHVTLH